MGESIEIKSSERVAIMGKTGSGKTYFAKALCSNDTRLLVIDSKANLAHWRTERVTSLTKLPEAIEKDGRVRYVPPTQEDADAAIGIAYHCGDVRIYIDEMYAIVPPGSRVPYWLNAAYTRGREFGIGVVACTQRPAWVPLIMFSEAEWLAMFRLQLTEDKTRAAGIIGDVATANIVDKHGFYLYNVNWDTPLYYKSLDVVTIKAREGAESGH